MTYFFYIATGCAVVSAIGAFVADDDMRGNRGVAVCLAVGFGLMAVFEFAFHEGQVEQLRLIRECASMKADPPPNRNYMLAVCSDSRNP